MPGFYISNAKDIPELADYRSSHMVRNEIKVDEYWVKQNTLDKFLDDKVFYQNNKQVIVTEGVTLNRIALIKEFNVISFVDVVIELRNCLQKVMYRRKPKQLAQL